MTREAVTDLGQEDEDPKEDTMWLLEHSELERFASLVAAAEREKLALWMRSMGYATGHGDTIEDLLDHLGTQISEGLEVEVLMEREACAKECDAVSASADNAALAGQYLVIRNGAEARRCAAAIRARSKT